MADSEKLDGSTKAGLSAIKTFNLQGRTSEFHLPASGQVSSASSSSSEATTKPSNSTASTANSSSPIFSSVDPPSAGYHALGAATTPTMLDATHRQAVEPLALSLVGYTQGSRVGSIVPSVVPSGDVSSGTGATGVGNFGGSMAHHDARSSYGVGSFRACTAINTATALAGEASSLVLMGGAPAAPPFADFRGNTVSATSTALAGEGSGLLLARATPTLPTERRTSLQSAFASSSGSTATSTTPDVEAVNSVLPHATSGSRSINDDGSATTATATTGLAGSSRSTNDTSTSALSRSSNPQLPDEMRVGESSGQGNLSCYQGVGHTGSRIEDEALLSKPVSIDGSREKDEEEDSVE